MRRLAVLRAGRLEVLDRHPELALCAHQSCVGRVVEALVAAPAHVENEADPSAAVAFGGFARAARGKDRGQGGCGARHAGQRARRHVALAFARLRRAAWAASTPRPSPCASTSMKIFFMRGSLARSSTSMALMMSSTSATVVFG